MDRPLASLLCASCVIGGAAALGLVTALVPLMGQGLVVVAGVAVFSGLSRLITDAPIRHEEEPWAPLEEDLEPDPPPQPSKMFERFLSIVEGDGDEED